MVASTKMIVLVSLLAAAALSTVFSERLLRSGSLVNACGAKVVIRAELIRRRIVYTVNSKPAVPDLLRVLNLVREERDDCEVVALVDDNSPIEEIGTIDGVAGKAGFSNVRFYVFNKDSGTMSAVQFGPNIPYSSNPPDE
jgi:hypothetical protein